MYHCHSDAETMVKPKKDNSHNQQTQIVVNPINRKLILKRFPSIDFILHSLVKHQSNLIVLLGTDTNCSVYHGWTNYLHQEQGFQNLLSAF